MRELLSFLKPALFSFRLRFEDGDCCSKASLSYTVATFSLFFFRVHISLLSSLFRKSYEDPCFCP